MEVPAPSLDFLEQPQPPQQAGAVSARILQLAVYNASWPLTLEVVESLFTPHAQLVCLMLQ